ncbi:hypothetical protein [Streptomyces sp. NPDC059597]|uniref:hypothetical protein n=1 Tax=Streptomyces sp. NPDC059597 TaxID=3346879 RepID=UPI0036AC6C6A
MTRTSHTLITLYTTTTAALAYYAASTYHHVPAPTTAVMAIAALLTGTAITREALLARARRNLAAHLERQAREQAGRDGPPLTAREDAAFRRLAAAIDLPGPADEGDEQ